MAKRNWTRDPNMDEVMLLFIVRIKIISVMIENNGVLSKIDPRMFYWFYITGSLLDILVLQIGDFI